MIKNNINNTNKVQKSASRKNTKGDFILDNRNSYTLISSPVGCSNSKRPVTRRLSILMDAPAGGGKSTSPIICTL